VKLIEFLKEAKKKKFWGDNRIIVFRSETFSLSFYKTFFSFLKDINVIQITPLHVEKKVELWKRLQQSFLGETSFYWLGDIVELVKKNKKKKNEPDIVELLSLYRGPHAIAFFLSSQHKISMSAQKRMFIVDLPHALSFPDICNLFSFFNKKFPVQKQKLIKDITLRAGMISLDTACMLIEYLSVTPIRFIDNLKRHLTTIIDPELSLYTLSQSFFAKEKKKFFKLWASCANEYSVPFWTVYWSEQLWRAYHVTKFLKENNFHAARRFSFRLPSSFIKYEWRRCSLPELKKSYSMIYDIDFAFKTGSLFCSLDLFYTKYFLGKFL
jgi:hypothetical protein